MIKEYFNKNICKECGGSCCRRIPGICLPEDIIKLFPSKSLKDSVILALKSGDYSIDYYEAEDNLYHIRPATLNHISVDIIDASWGGQCIFLDSNGCKLTDELRPHLCRILKPGKIECTTDLKENAKLYYGKIWKKSGVDLFKIAKDM